MNWKSPAGAWIPFLIRVEGRKSQRSFLLLKQSLVKSSYPEKIGLFKNEIRVVGFFIFFLPFKVVNFGGFLLLSVLQNGVHAVYGVQR